MDGVDIVESEGFWLLGVWLSARESLERDGYLFLLREVSSILYTYATVSVSSFRNVNCTRVCEYVRASVCAVDVCCRRCGITVRIFENLSNSRLVQCPHFIAYISFDFTFRMLFNYAKYIAIVKTLVKAHVIWHNLYGSLINFSLFMYVDRAFYR